MAELHSIEAIDPAAIVGFDGDDVDAAFADLESRYLTGEAAAYAPAWSAVLQAYGALNNHERPHWTTEFESIDHRKGVAIAPGELAAYVDAIWDDTPGVRVYIEAVHRLSDVGVLVTHVTTGTSHHEFEAEWRTVTLSVLDAERIARTELFDEADLDLALARFDELSLPAPTLCNAAIRTWTRLAEAFNRRDVEEFLALIAADGRIEDRRRGLRAIHEGKARREGVRALFDASPNSWRMEVEAIAIRGSRLSLTRERYRDNAIADSPITVELLTVLELSDDGLVRETVDFDPDDVDGAIAELTARWIAAGEVAHPEVIEAQLRFGEAANRHDWDALADMNAGGTYVNHRQLASGADTVVDDMSSLRMLASLVPDLRFELAEVLAYSAKGVVNGVVVKGTSSEGVAVELPWVTLQIFDGDRVMHVETFDADQRELALARFEELNRTD